MVPIDLLDGSLDMILGSHAWFLVVLSRMW